MKRLIIGTLFFIIISFAAQSISHFGINASHYADIEFMRPEPIFALGLFTMILQGLILSYIFDRYYSENYDLKGGLFFGLLIGIFFISYPALVEPAKYAVPSVLKWFLVEASVGLVQFSVFGVSLGWLFMKSMNK